MTTDLIYMSLAIEEARRAKQDGELPIGAVVVVGDRIIARNRCRETRERTVLAHAELYAVDDACRALGRNVLDECSIYCTNEPCLMCAAAIFQAKISKVVIGASRRDLPEVFRQRTLHIGDLAADSGYSPMIVADVMRHEVLELFEVVARK